MTLWHYGTEGSALLSFWRQIVMVFLAWRIFLPAESFRTQFLPAPIALAVYIVTFHSFNTTHLLTPTTIGHSNQFRLVLLANTEYCRVYRMLKSYRASVRISWCLSESYQIRINSVFLWIDIADCNLQMLHSWCASLPYLMFQSSDRKTIWIAAR